MGLPRSVGGWPPSEQVYRVISFFVMGLLMIAASYLYHKVETRLATDEDG